MKLSKINIFAIIMLAIVACIPRSIELINQNFVFGFDQGHHWLGAKSIIIDHKLPLIGDEVGGARGFFQGPGWLYTLSLFYALFRGNPYGGIVFMFLSGVATVLLAVWLFKKSLGTETSFVIGFLLAISPILIESSRMVWPPHVIPMITVMLLYCVLKVIQKRYSYLPALFFITGSMNHYEIASAGMTFFVLLLLVIPFGIVRRIPIRYFIFSVVAWIIPFAPLILFDLRHDFLNVKGVIETFGGPRQVQSSITLLIANHQAVFSHNIFHAFQTLYFPRIIVGLFFLVGLGEFFDKKVLKTTKIFLAFLYVFGMVLFAMLLFYKNDVWPWWFYQLSVIVVTLFGLILSWLANKNRIGFAIAFLSLILMGAGYIQENIRFWKNDFPDYGGVHKIRGKQDAIDFIYKDANGLPFGLFVFSPPIYSYPYDFLIWWYGQKKYGYVPKQEKLSTYYLLAEPDPEKPWTYKGWMETAVTGGTDIGRWELPSGFVVVKRKM